MAVNLLEMAKGYLTDAVISRTSGALTENPEGIQKALAGALPIFLSGLISRGNSPDGPGFITSLIEQFMGNDAGPESDAPEQLIEKGSGLTGSLFGPGSTLISSALARFSGIKSESASGVLGMAGSVIIGLLGRQLMSQPGGITASGLVGLLASQREFIGAAMPAGLSALMGNIPGLGGLLGSGGAAVKGAVGALGSAVSGATSFGTKGAAGRAEHTPAYSDDISNQPKGFNFWPWVMAAVAAGLLFYFLRGSGNSTDTATISTTNDTTSASVQDATANMDSAATSAGALVDSASGSIAAAADSAGSALANAAASLGTFGAKKLPDGVELTIPANGIENKLISFIEDPSKVVDKTTWFNFDRLLYETGSANLKPESREQLQNIAAILKAYPAVNLKIGGYTDNTGNAASNKKLSQSRADAAMTELVRLGVGQTRLEVEGYGIEHPIASNKTEEGRAQNRRTAIRVTKK